MLLLPMEAEANSMHQHEITIFFVVRAISCNWDCYNFAKYSCSWLLHGQSGVFSGIG